MRSYGLLEGQVRIRVQSMWQTSPPPPSLKEILSRQYFYMHSNAGYIIEIGEGSVRIISPFTSCHSAGGCQEKVRVLQLKWQYLEPHEDELGWDQQSSTSYDLRWHILDSARQKYWWCLCWLEYLKKSSWTTQNDYSRAPLMRSLWGTLLYVQYTRQMMLIPGGDPELCCRWHAKGEGEVYRRP